MIYQLTVDGITSRRTDSIHRHMAEGIDDCCSTARRWSRTAWTWSPDVESCEQCWLEYGHDGPKKFCVHREVAQ